MHPGHPRARLLCPAAHPQICSANHYTWFPCMLLIGIAAGQAHQQTTSNDSCCPASPTFWFTLLVHARLQPLHKLPNGQCRQLAAHAVGQEKAAGTGAAGELERAPALRPRVHRCFDCRDDAKQQASRDDGMGAVGVMGCESEQPRASARGLLREACTAPGAAPRRRCGSYNPAALTHLPARRTPARHPRTTTASLQCAAACHAGGKPAGSEAGGGGSVGRRPAPQQSPARLDPSPAAPGVMPSPKAAQGGRHCLPFPTLPVPLAWKPASSPCCAIITH